MPKENAEAIVSLLNKALAIRNDLIFDVSDEEIFYGKSANPDKVVTIIDGGAEEIAIDMRVKNTKEILGSLYLLPYDCDIVYDYTDNEFCNKIME